VPQTIQDRYRDLNLSFIANPVRKDISTLSDADAVQRSVMNLVLTKHYERPFHPEIGCNVTAMLFENITAITAINIKRSIEDVLRNFEPRATATSVVVNPNLEENGYNITINFFVNNVRDQVSVSVFLERLR
jgi:phage baseplate assembly protein W